MTIFTSEVLYTPERVIREAAILVEDGKIARVGPRSALEAASSQRIFDFDDSAIVPGFIDLHNHGGVGCDVMRGSVSDRKRMEGFLASHGTAAYFPTTVTAPIDVILSALEQLADAIEGGDDRAGRAKPLGIHLEGPFLSHAKRGVHQAKDLLPPTIGAFERFWQSARGHLRMMTIAPEVDGAEEVIAEAARRGVCVSLGHSDANLEQARRGFKAGGRHATHTFNAMRPLDHKDPGILGEVLTNNGMTADVIADGIHVHPEAVDLLVRAKGIENVALITDALSATGMPDGKYVLGTMEVEVKDRRCLHNGTLAGSVLTLDQAVRNVMEFAHLDLQQAVRAATLNPAKAAGILGKGTIDPGADADFVVLTAKGEVKATVIAGEVVQ
jgi:N-acetylglucosamine-6-phosphate deacetylase